jgi:hypothetical protein
MKERETNKRTIYGVAVLLLLSNTGELVDFKNILSPGYCQ